MSTKLKLLSIDLASLHRNQDNRKLRDGEIAMHTNLIHHVNVQTQSQEKWDDLWVATLAGNVQSSLAVLQKENIIALLVDCSAI